MIGYDMVGTVGKDGEHQAVTIDGQKIAYKLLVTRFKTLLDKTPTALAEPEDIPTIKIGEKDYNLVDLAGKLPTETQKLIYDLEGLKKQKLIPLLEAIAKSEHIDPGLKLKAAKLRLQHVQSLSNAISRAGSKTSKTDPKRSASVIAEAHKRVEERKKRIAAQVLANKGAEAPVAAPRPKSAAKKQEALEESKREWARDLKAFSMNVNVRARKANAEPFKKFEKAVARLSTETQAREILDAYVKAEPEVQEAYKSQKLAQAKYAQKFFNSPGADLILQGSTKASKGMDAIKNAEISDKNARLISARFTRLRKAHPLINDAYEAWVKDEAAKRKAQEIGSVAAAFLHDSRGPNPTPPRSTSNSPEPDLLPNGQPRISPKGRRSRVNDPSKGQASGHMKPPTESGKVWIGLEPRGQRMGGKRTNKEQWPTPPPTPPGTRKSIKQTGLTVGITKA